LRGDAFARLIASFATMRRIQGRTVAPSRKRPNALNLGFLSS